MMDEGNQEVAPANRTFKIRPRSIVCRICGNKFGTTASIDIHAKQCQLN